LLQDILHFTFGNNLGAAFSQFLNPVFEQGVHFFSSALFLVSGVMIILSSRSKGFGTCLPSINVSHKLSLFY
jgi:hypothetical protein